MSDPNPPPLTAEEIRLGSTRQAEETLTTMRERAAQAESELEEKLAWRREQLEREIAALEARKAAALAQLGDLRALAEESDELFAAADEPTTRITPQKP